jgi:hypothetical protein
MHIKILYKLYNITKTCYIPNVARILGGSRTKRYNPKSFIFKRLRMRGGSPSIQDCIALLKTNFRSKNDRLVVRETLNTIYGKCTLDVLNKEFLPWELYQFGFSIRELIDTGYSINELIHAGLEKEIFTSTEHDTLTSDEKQKAIVENERFKIPYRGDESDIEEKEEEEEEREKAAMYIREAAEEVAAAEEYDEEGDWLEGAIERLNIAKRHAAAVEQRQKARAEEHEVSEAAMWIREAEAEVAAAEKYDEEGDWLESATERLNNAKRHALKSTANSPSKP